MAPIKSTLMIRDYENIRKILRDIYIFGCFTKSDFVEMGYSGRKVDKEQQRISAYLPSKFLKKRRVDKKVIQYCRYSISDSNKNYLAETYRNKSFTMLDIMSYFYILQLLGDGKERTLPEILEMLPCCNVEVEFSKDNLRIKLEELLENCFISARKDGRNVRYSISDDVWKDFSDDELIDIITYLEFIKNVSPIEMPYYFLQRRLKLYLFSERKLKLDGRNPFQFKHNHIFNSLDNDVLIECLMSIQDCCSIVIEKDGGKNAINALPIKIIHDSTYGRQYLLFYNIDYKCINNIRVDHIKNVIVGKKMTEEEKKIVNDNKNYDDLCWSVSSIIEEPQEVIVEFYFDEKKEFFIFNRIKREGHGGTIKKMSDGVFEYRITLRDPKEIIPWVRSFGERAKVISSGTHEIEITIATDWEKAANKYEAL